MRFTLSRSATPPQTPLPASRVAFHRAKAVRTYTGVRWWLLAILAWKLLWVLTSLGLVRVFVAVPGGAPVDAANTLWSWIQQGAQNTEVLGILVSWVGIMWLAPIVCRFISDISLRKATCEGATIQRRREKFLHKSSHRLLGLGAVATLVVIALPPTRVLGLMIVAMPLSLYSFQFLAASLHTRIGPFLTCARCGYRMSSWRRSKDPCPECGNLWKQPWGAALGVPGIRWDLVMLGAGMQIASLLAMVWLMWGWWPRS